MAADPKTVVNGYPAGEAAAATGTSSSYPTTAAYPAGTAYTYPAPPYYGGPAPPPPPHQHYYYHNSYEDGRRSNALLHRLIIAFIAVFLVVVIATFISWLVLRTRLPIFAVSSASITSFNLPNSSQELSMHLNLTFAVNNPNKKMGIYYDSAEAAVLYKFATISVTALPPFFQAKQNSTVLSAEFAAASMYLDGDAVKGISQEKASSGAVEFHVRLFAWVRFKDGAWRTRRHSMRVYCDNLRFGFSNSTGSVGSLQGGPKQCRVNLYIPKRFGPCY